MEEGGGGWRVEGEAVADTPQTPTGPGEGGGGGGLQKTLPCMDLQPLWWKVVYHNISSRLHLSAAEVK